MNQNFFLVGVYEDFEHVIFPTHVSPIIVELASKGYRRWNYRVCKPFRIELETPIGTYKSSIDSLFPKPSYQLVPLKNIKSKSQVIAISKEKVIVEQSHVVIALKLITYLIINFKDKGYIERAWLTLKNSFS